MDLTLPNHRLISGFAALCLLAAPAAAEDARRFDIEEFRVEGNSLLSAADLEIAVTPFLGPGRTADDVEKARAALDLLYAQRGYPTAAAEVPEQDPSDGVVVLKVVERRVGRLRVNGARYFSPNDVRRGVPSLAEGKVPNLNDVQREIVALNQWPDRRVTPVLRPGARPGTVDVDLNIKDTLPLQASVEVANRRSANTSALRTSASLGYGNLWQRGDSVSLSYQVAPQRPGDTQVMSASYLYRIPGSNVALLVSYLHSDSDVSTAGGTGVIGKGNIIGLRAQIPLGTDGPFSHSLSLGFDHKSFRDTILLGADRTITPIAYMPLVAQYQASWLGDGNETLVTATASLGTRGLGSDAVAFDQKRYRAQPDFATLRGEAIRRDDLPAGWQSSFRLTGQVAGDPLISNEQFSIGGMDTVRGFLESEALGDWGAALQSEIRGPALTELIDKIIDEIRGFAFLDGARVGIRDALAQQARGHVLAAAGLGVRLRVLDTVSADVIGANLLTRGPNSREGASRLLFRVSGAF